MKDMTSILKSTLSNQRAALFGFAVLAALALGTAFISQYAYGLQPCVLCIYQRWPYGIVIALGVLGLWLAGKNANAGPLLLGLIGLTFLANSAIAFYHTGVERHWWKSFLEGCAVPSLEGNITDVMARIAATPAARCDEIPWTDPVLGLSMANYNVFACAVLAALAFYACAATRRTS